MQTKIRGIDRVSADERDIKSTPEGMILAALGHGKYREAASRGNVYSAMNQTGCVWTVELATTYTGLAVSNPINSNKRLSILAAGYLEVVAPTGIAAISLAGGYHASTNVIAGVAGTPQSMLVGNAAAAVGKCWTGATLPVAPVYLLPLIAGHTSGALSTAAARILTAIDGLVEVLPGGFVIIANFTIGVAVGGLGAIVWEEIDL